MPASVRTFASEVRAMLGASILIATLLAFAGWDIQRQVGVSASYQSKIREAQTLRSAFLRAQIDEETGVRGFLASRNPVYLTPYRDALVTFKAHGAKLHALLLELKRERERDIVEEETSLNGLWIQAIALPLIEHPAPPNLRLLLAGKALVDNFRDRDTQLTADLDEDAAVADATLQHALAEQIFFVVALLVLVTGGGVVVAYFLARGARREFESRVLYQNQKRLADSLQTAFLQKTLPMTPGIGLHAMYVPATTEAQVGGDWYDAFTLPDGRLLFSIGDVAGHGIEAAIVMSRARQAIVAAAVREDDPARVLGRANDAIILQESRMVTAICGFIDPTTLEISYATAGHPAPVIARTDAAAEFLDHDGIPLGIVPGTTYRTFVTTASQNALLVFYTDGVIEHKRDIFAGERRLLAAVDAAVGSVDPALTIHQAIFASSAATDDVAIFTVTFRGAEGAKPGEASIAALQRSSLNVAGRAS